MLKIINYEKYLRKNTLLHCNGKISDRTGTGKYNLDFCCKGKRTLSEACAEMGLPLNVIEKELNHVVNAAEKKHLPFTEMNAEQLISYILIHHHFYVKQSMPGIFFHLQKVALKHGDKFPYMQKVLKLFSVVKDEMTAHMQKEELILFPRIRSTEVLVSKNGPIRIPESYISMPVNMMEAEHENAGAILYSIRELTNNYTAPHGACTTFKLSLTELKEFEENLHRHVHLENNLLFPMAKKMFHTIVKSNR